LNSKINLKLFSLVWTLEYSAQPWWQFS